MFVILGLLTPLAAQPAATLEVDIERVRNQSGMIHACLSKDPRHFPDCRADPGAMKLTVPAAARQIRFTRVPPGRYALTLFHDENGNQRLDTFLGIPREGFGFSRNPKVRFGAPKFNQVDIQIVDGIARQAVRMQYLL